MKKPQGGHPRGVYRVVCLKNRLFRLVHLEENALDEVQAFFGFIGDIAGGEIIGKFWSEVHSDIGLLSRPRNPDSEKDDPKDGRDLGSAVMERPVIGRSVIVRTCSQTTSTEQETDTAHSENRSNGVEVEYPIDFPSTHVALLSFASGAFMDFFRRVIIPIGFLNPIVPLFLEPGFIGVPEHGFVVCDAVPRTALSLPHPTLLELK